jgi:hypothetical protein
VRGFAFRLEQRERVAVGRLHHIEPVLPEMPLEEALVAVPGSARRKGVRHAATLPTDATNGFPQQLDVL